MKTGLREVDNSLLIHNLFHNFYPQIVDIL